MEDFRLGWQLSKSVLYTYTLPNKVVPAMYYHIKDRK